MKVERGTGREKKLQQQQKNAIICKIGKWFCPGTSRDRRVCPGILDPALVPGQRDAGTRKCCCPGTKGQRDVPSLGNTSIKHQWPMIYFSLQIVEYWLLTSSWDQTTEQQISNLQNFFKLYYDFFFNCSDWEKVKGKIGENKIHCLVIWFHVLVIST